MLFVAACYDNSIDRLSCLTTTSTLVDREPYPEAKVHRSHDTLQSQATCRKQIDDGDEGIGISTTLHEFTQRC